MAFAMARSSALSHDVESGQHLTLGSKKMAA
jgi:hypothetical protein